jgi:hypothetical protein
MNDCPDAEIRDRLPDLLHDRLTVSGRAAVIAHIDGCVDCRQELELLRGVRSVLVTPAPRIEISHIVSALPKPPSRRVQPASPRKRTWVDWRVAAAVTLLAVGGSSVAIVNRETVADVPPVAQSLPASPSQPGVNTTAQPVAPAVVAVVPARPSGASRETLIVASAEQGASAGVDIAGRLADLNDQQLQALLDEIDQMRAVPITEPEPVTIKVDARRMSPDDGRE